jgi:hypothetical protein
MDIENDAPAQPKVIIPAGRQVEKKTMCANCIHYETGNRVADDWFGDPNTQGDLAQARGLIDLFGIRLEQEWEDNAGLAVARAVGRGLSQEAAILELEKRRLLEAQKRAGKGDIRMQDKRIMAFRERCVGIVAGKYGRCTGKGFTLTLKDHEGQEAPLGKSIIFSAFHCRHWSGATGWSVAHNGEALDPLPAEMVARADEKATPSAR